MSIENLIEIANLLDGASLGEGGTALASNAIDMALQEVTASSEPFENAVKCIIVYANLLDVDGHTSAARALDHVLDMLSSKMSKTAATREELYDSKANNEATLFNSLIAEIENVDPVYEGLQGGATALATRNSPDHPGVMMLRVSDGVYQDIMSKKIYDFNKGWVDEQGEKHQGGSVANQTPIYNQYLYLPQIFESRRFTSRNR